MSAAESNGKNNRKISPPRLAAAKDERGKKVTLASSSAELLTPAHILLRSEGRLRPALIPLVRLPPDVETGRRLMPFPVVCKVRDVEEEGEKQHQQQEQIATAAAAIDTDDNDDVDNKGKSLLSSREKTKSHGALLLGGGVPGVIPMMSLKRGNSTPLLKRNISTISRQDSLRLDDEVEVVGDLSLLDDLTPGGERRRKIVATVHAAWSALNLKACEITDEEVAVLISCINDSITAIDVSYNLFGAEGCRTLFGRLGTVENLKTVHLSFTPIEDDGLTHLAKFLLTSNVIDLCVRGCRMSYIGAEKLAYAIADSSSLRSVNMSFNPIGQRGASAIGKAVYKSKIMQRLRLDRCDIGTQGASYIAAAAAKSRTLTHLSLAFNDIEMSGGQAFAKALSTKGCPLQFLDLGNNKLDKEVATLLMVAGLRRVGNVDIRLMGPKLNANGYHAVKERLASLSSNQLKRHLR